MLTSQSLAASLAWASRVVQVRRLNWRIRCTGCLTPSLLCRSQWAAPSHRAHLSQWEGSADGVGDDGKELLLCQDSRTLPEVLSLSLLFLIGWVRRHLRMMAGARQKPPEGRFPPFSAFILFCIVRRRKFPGDPKPFKAMSALHSLICAALALDVHGIQGQLMILLQ